MSDDVTFALVSPVASPDELQVKSLRGEEQVNEAYRFQIVARAPVAASRLQEWDGTLPGSRATLRLGPRPVHGLVTAFEVTGPLDRGAFEVRLTLEPRLALLDLNVDHRIWQDLTVAEVAAELLTSWDVDHAVRVEGPHRPRRYLTQRDESDYDFLRRILASEGIFFLFEHPDDGDADAPGRERVIIADVAALTPEIAGGAALRFVGDTDA
ncbi:MAG: phage late control D family protein, partial [Myxococcota bacterium]